MGKITVLIIFFLSISFGLIKAQTNKGNILTGVSSSFSFAGTGSDLLNVGYTTIKYKSDAAGYEEGSPNKITSINFLPKMGFFVEDNIVFGFDLSYAYSFTKEGDGDVNYSQALIGIGPFVRFYIPVSKVYPFIEASGLFGSLKMKYDYTDNTYWDDEEYKSEIKSFGGGVGLAAPLGEKVMFDILIGYNSITVKDKEDNADNNRVVRGTMGLKLGFTLILGANKSKE